MMLLGYWADHAQTFALCVMVLTTSLFALPIFVAPISWAKWFLWRILEDTDLAIYFARCLGGFILILELALLRAVLTGEGIIFAYQFLLCAAFFMFLTHLVGLLQRIQPWTENVEVIGYAALFALTWMFYPVS
jgi:hypothetical protein